MIQFSAGRDGLAERGFSADLDVPAFPLNFDPQELLAEVDAGSDPQLNLQEILDLDIFGSPHALDDPESNALPNAQTRAPVHGSKDSMTSPSRGSHASQQQSTPGVFELFQLQHVVPSNVFNQPMQWPSQQPAAQQQEMQPAAQRSDIPQQPVYQQQYQQLPQLPMQQQFLSPVQQPQQQFLYYAPNGFQQQQTMLLQQQQPNSFLLQSSVPQQALYAAAPNGSYTGQQPVYIPQQQIAAEMPMTATPFMMSAGYPAAPAGQTAVAMDPGQGLTLPAAAQTLAPVTVVTAGTGSGSLSSPMGMSFQMPLGSATAAANDAAQAATAGHTRKGRSKTVAAPPPLGTDKPKGPSRRFRERQKETISNLEAEVTEKLAQLQALSAENEMLKLRSAVLEATVKGREYHMRVIKEHGPPVFDATEQRAADMLAVCVPGVELDSPAVSHCQSGVSAGSGLRGTFSDSEADAAGATTDGETVTHGLLHCSSGVSNGATAAGASPTTAGPINGGCGDESLECCDAPQMCSPAQQKKTINVLKHMSSEDIIRHWKHFLHDVSGELLVAEQEEQQEKLRKLQRYGKDVDEDSTCTSAHEHVGKSCRWCSNCDDPTVEHSEDNCRAAAEERAAAAAAAAQQGPSCTEGLNVGACCDVKPLPGTAGFGGGVQRQVSDCQSAGRCTASEGRIVALVNKYSYMTKFVALLNPGVLYHLFGRHLDTGLAAPYTDDHWRQVVSRLGLSKHQVTVILACAELYFSSLTKLLDQRRVLQQQLKQADEGLSECQKRLRGLDGIHNQLEVLDALASNLKREHVLRIMLNCFVWGRSLNSIQFAKSAVYSHPFFPDVHAFVCVLYEDARAMAPNGQPALVFPHRQQHKETLVKTEAPNGDQQQQQQPNEQQQQQSLQALHEQLRAQSEELRLQAINAKSGGSSSGLAFQS
eukprot:GHUV01000811.1.p1 GENE.GHUV01000811.1~~GHUV01000811.1.p1  ORF type:complete len:928 (+),score=335.74 GHUV01000811.1:282-3065(+)